MVGIIEPHKQKRAVRCKIMSQFFLFFWWWGGCWGVGEGRVCARQITRWNEAFSKKKHVEQNYVNRMESANSYCLGCSLRLINLCLAGCGSARAEPRSRGLNPADKSHAENNFKTRGSAKTSEAPRSSNLICNVRTSQLRPLHIR